MNLGSILGIGGSNTGSGYQAGTTTIDPAVQQAQIDAQYANAQSNFANQNSFLNALNAQNGIANQTAAFNQQQGLASQLGGGVQNQNNTFQQQAALAQQLQQIANGQGPNPAQAMLSQSTGANVANQAALMAGQRGTSANPGLESQLIAEQGANTQQQSIGQAATLQAQQSLNALGQVGTQQQNMQQVAANQVAQQQAQEQAVQAAATQQVGQQQTGIVNQGQLTQNEQQNLLNAMSQYNNANVGLQSNINTTNAGVQGIVAGGQSSLLGGLLGGVGLAGAAASAAHGGMISDIPNYCNGGQVPNYCNGGQVPTNMWSGGIFNNNQNSSIDPNAPQSIAGKFLNGFNTASQSKNPLSTGANQFGQGLGQTIGSFFNSPPPVYATGENSSPDTVMNKGGKVMRFGGKVPGKDNVKGDSLENDTVNAKLSPGEIVIPVSITQGKDPITEGARFIAATLAKHYGTASGLKYA